MAKVYCCEERYCRIFFKLRHGRKHTYIYIVHLNKGEETDVAAYHHTPNMHTTSNDSGISRRSSSVCQNGKMSDHKEENKSDLKLEYTEDQLEAVQRVKNCKDYYEILCVQKDSDESELKKQYRKLALQLHPDKNKAPGASEAFKGVSNAFAVLSDPIKRKQYDAYGAEYLQRRNGHASHDGHFDYSRGFEGDISPEEIFSMFFGGGFAQSYGGNVYVRRGNQWHHYRQPTATHQESSHSVILQMMPLLVLVSLSLIGSFFSTDPPYSLSRTTKYYYEQRTRNMEIPYYVKENFLTDYKGKIPKIEAQVEDDYLSNMRTSCFRERNYKESMIWRAKNFGDVNLESKARNLRTPSCDALNELYRSGRLL